MDMRDPDNKSEDRLKVFTIGHSNHEVDHFLELLRRNGIQVLADVRSSPYSRYAVQYNHETIERLIERENIEYQYLGSALGGKPANPEFYDDDGRVLYGQIAESEWFQEGISFLVRLIRNYTVALMCSEENPEGCHRRLLIGRVLTERDIEVVHIRGDGSIRTEKELREAETMEKDKGQISLFASEEPKEWKSIR